MTGAREVELKGYIDALVASSVETHAILETPSPTMTLKESAERVMAELKQLRDQNGKLIARWRDDRAHGGNSEGFRNGLLNCAVELENVLAGKVFEIDA